MGKTCTKIRITKVKSEFLIYTVQTLLYSQDKFSEWEFKGWSLQRTVKLEHDHKFCITLSVTMAITPSSSRSPSHCQSQLLLPSTTFPSQSGSSYFEEEKTTEMLISWTTVQVYRENDHKLTYKIKWLWVCEKSECLHLCYFWKIKENSIWKWMNQNASYETFVDAFTSAVKMRESNQY